MSTKQTTAIGYGRTSSESGENKVSVDVQKTDFEAWCKSKEYQGHWFEDRDISGRSYPTGAEVSRYDSITADYLRDKPKNKQTRKGLAQALQCAAQHKASILWVRDVTRFARPVSGSMLAPYLRGELQRLGLMLWSGETGAIDFSKLETSLVQNIQAEIEDAAIKSKKAQASASRDLKQNQGLMGWYTSSSFYGYRTAGKQRVEAIEEELKIVRTIFEKWLSGLSVNQITKWLIKESVITKQGGVWSRPTVRKILTRSQYAGLQYDTQGNLIPSKLFKPIITKAEFLQSKARLQRNKVDTVKESCFIHPLQGLVKCGVCGETLRTFNTVAANGNHARYYKCQNYDSNPSCRPTLIRETIGELAIRGQTKGYLSEFRKGYGGAGLIEAVYPLLIPAYIRLLNQKDTTPSLLEKVEVLKTELALIKSKNVGRYKDFENGMFDRDTYLALTQETKEQETALLKELKSTQDEIAKQASKTVLTVQDLDHLKDIPAQEFQTLIKTIVEKILVYPDKIEIHLHNEPTPITIPRIKIRHSRGLPLPVYTVGVDGGSYNYDKHTKKSQVKNPATNHLVPTVTITYPVPDSKSITLLYLNDSFTQV